MIDETTKQQLEADYVEWRRRDARFENIESVILFIKASAERYHLSHDELCDFMESFWRREGRGFHKVVKLLRRMIAFVEENRLERLSDATAEQRAEFDRKFHNEIMQELHAPEKEEER